MASDSVANIALPALFNSMKLRTTFFRNRKQWDDEIPVDSSKYRKINNKSEYKVFERIKQNKIKNIDIFRTLFPEYRILFIGDPGQSDVEVAQYLLKSQKNSYAVIHDIKRIHYNKKEKQIIQSVYSMRYPELVRRKPNKLFVSNDYYKILKHVENIGLFF